MGGRYVLHKTLIAFTMFSIMAIGLSIVYAEEFTVDVPFDFGDNGCTLYEDGELKRYECYMQESKFTNPDHLSTETENGCEEGYVRDIVTEECKLPEVLEEEAIQRCYDDPTCPVGIWHDPVTDKIVNNQEKIIDDETSTAQKIENSFIKSLKDMCSYDINLYQDGSEFEIALEKFVDPETGEIRTQFKKMFMNESIDLQNYPELKRLVLAVEACIGQQKLKVQEAIAFRATPDYVGVQQPYHAQVASGIPPFSQARVNAESNENHTNLSWKNIVCNSTGQYDHRYKQIIGCNDSEYFSIRDAPQMEDAFNAEIQAKIRQYNQDGGREMAKEIHKQKIAEQLLSLQKQLRSFDK